MRQLELMLRRRRIPICGVIAILFLSTQFLGMAHAAQYGDPSHHHDEIPCAIQFVVETAKGLLAPATDCDPTPSITPDIPSLGLVRRVYLSSGISNRSIRGPPSLLF
jgi:hypothetical protein